MNKKQQNKRADRLFVGESSPTKSRLFVNTVLADLSTLKDVIEALDKVLQDEDFEVSEATDYCDEIEQLAIAIREGVETGDQQP